MALKLYQCFKTIHAEDMLAGEFFNSIGSEMPEGLSAESKGVRVILNSGTVSEHSEWCTPNDFREKYTYNDFREINEQSEEGIIKYFSFSHLPPHLQAISAPMCRLAHLMDGRIKDGDEKTQGLRKLLEAKDCFVRAYLD